MSDAAARKLAHRREAQEQMTAAGAKALQEAAARVSPEVFGDAGTREGATIERARRYIAEALQPLVDMKVATQFTVALVQDTPERISGTITIFRGPKTAIALQFADIWRDFGG